MPKSNTKRNVFDRPAEVVNFAMYRGLRLTSHDPSLAMEIVRNCPNLHAGADAKLSETISRRRAEKGRKGSKGELVKFPARMAFPGGIYELDRRGVVTHFNPAHPPAPALVGLDFFDAIAPGLRNLRGDYIRFLLSDATDYETAASGRVFIFVKVLDCAVVTVNREGGAG